MTKYHGTFRTQFDGGSLASQNCVPASLAMGADEGTGGRVVRTASQVRALLPRSEETDPATPGWSLRDADVVAAKLGVEFTHTLGSWSNLVTRRNEGRGIILQGDSDRFPGSCSGAFDGAHCIYVCNKTSSTGHWLIGDPICREWRWENPTILRAYAEKFGKGKVSYGWTAVIPEIATVPSQPEDDMGVAFRIVQPYVGTVKVKTDAPHSQIRLRDGARIGIPGGSVREVVAKVALLEPLDASSGDRTNGWLIGRQTAPTAEPSNVEASFILATDVVATPAGVTAAHNQGVTAASKKALEAKL